MSLIESQQRTIESLSRTIENFQRNSYGIYSSKEKDDVLNKIIAEDIYLFMKKRNVHSR